MATKVKVTIAFDVELPITDEDAQNAYGGCIDPLATLALSEVSKLSMLELIEESFGKTMVGFEVQE